jgi:RimJ/RimL family protein N-acetyltransferase
MIWWPAQIPTLSHGLITLRPATEDDIDSIFHACQDPLIPAFTTVPSNYTIDHAIEFVRNIPFAFLERREILFIIEFGNGADKEFAGEISLHSVNIRNHTAEIGYWIAAPFRGKGIGRTAATMITNLGLQEIGFKRIEALVDVDNHMSQKLLMSAGYVKEGIMANKATREDGRQIDMALFAATDLTWER